MRKAVLWLLLLWSSQAVCAEGPYAQNLALRRERTPTAFYNSSTTAVDRTRSPDITTTTTDITATDGDSRPTQSTTTDDPRNPPDEPTGEAITHTSNCTPGIVTVTNTVPETVYVTVDGSYEVTVSNRNVSIVAPTIFETPLDACTTTIVPKKTTLDPQITGPVLTSTRDPEFVPPTVVKETSTIVVTKKTPVPFVPSSTDTGPPVTFRDPKTDAQPTAPIQQIDTANGESAGPTTSIPSSPAGGGVGGSTAIDGPRNTVTNGPGNNINSPTSSPSNPPPLTSGFVAAPATPTINGVPITIGPTAVIIGGQNIVLSTTSQSIVVANAQTFTVRQSEILAAGTTFQIANQLSGVSTVIQPTSVVTIAGATLSIGASLAIIAETTYRIGPGASSTTVVVNGQTIGVGANGIALAGATLTTYAPAATVAGGYEIVVVSGVTISVAQTQAVISGTTYNIGTGAKTTTVDIAGLTVTIGPTGIIFPSTTIKQTIVPTVLASVSSRSTSTATATSSSGSESSSGLSVGSFGLFRPLACLLALVGPGVFAM